ncbi:riboflavin biosynthesis [Raphidocelis subcapitata]|uniref:Riboflavin biosynthesis protein PYRD, chloroplastic n=1 Tax=Raphidocelis subcapitata TaxID=307507 RepID=A0A2V0NYF5_9CHLO|nr:riboflavin biosynthesis [Raphidocelis subcapitata]|eukprot:GBF92646.1 riboflavin biosynthesis [Raphidocelis subcapitata]
MALARSVPAAGSSRACGTSKLRRAPVSVAAPAASAARGAAPTRRRAPMCAAAALSPVTGEDRVFMNAALDLAMRAYGKTHPNPHVGCVIVRDGAVVGEGFHPQAGQPHAEVFALRGAGQAARGATAYVTLEPCNHYGRTPPCSQALVEAGVARVVVGAGDPNPLVAAAGIATLQAAGIEVALMDGAENARALDINRDFLARMEAEARESAAQAAAIAAKRAAAGAATR